MSTFAFTSGQKPMIVYINGRKFRLSKVGLYNPIIRPYGYHKNNSLGNNFSRYLHDLPIPKNSKLLKFSVSSCGDIVRLKNFSTYSCLL
jgi:hypothetical protein